MYVRRRFTLPNVNQVQMVALLAWTTAVFLPERGAAQSATFQALEDLPGGAHSSAAIGVSADGSVVVGTGAAESVAFAMRWTQSTGMVQLPDLPGGLILNVAADVSADGMVVVGSGFLGNNVLACRWTFNSAASQWVVQNIGMLPGAYPGSNAAVSADGNIVVGFSCSDANCTSERGFLWTAPAGPMMVLGDLPGSLLRSYAHDVTADGTAIAGESWGAPNSQQACRWQQRGADWIPQPPGDLPGSDFQSLGYGISDDALVVVGASSSANANYWEAFRWVDPGPMVGLGDLHGGEFHSQALAVSSDGTIVVGQATIDTGSAAFVWSQAYGMRDLKQALIDFGAAGITDWRLTLANDVQQMAA